MDNFDPNPPRPAANGFEKPEFVPLPRNIDAALGSQVTTPRKKAVGEETANSERRRKRRAIISTPVRVRSLDVTRERADEISSTIDVSRNGILLLSRSQAFHRGMEVAVTLPYLKARDAVLAEQPGVVVRVSATSNGQVAVAVAFGTGFAADLVASSRPKHEAATPANEFAAHADRKKPLVLVVESEDSIKDCTKAFLCAQGYDVIAVGNARDAREVLNMFTPVLLIAEIEGDGLPGFDLCAHVKATPRLQHIPVMLTTRSAYPSDYSSAHSLGAVVCMAKPYRLERLGHVVGLLAPHPGAKDCKEPPRPADPTRRPRRPGHHGAHPRLRFS
jgi:CheY-like chemotaxis protein